MKMKLAAIVVFALICAAPFAMGRIPAAPTTSRPAQK